MKNFDFAEWSDLYKADPQAFEARRIDTLRALIDQAAGEHRQHLELTLSKIELTRRASKGRLDGALKASNLMWDSYGRLQAIINQTLDLIDPSAPKKAVAPAAARASATILPFRIHHKAG
jgi:hypothetical protein